MHGLRQYTFQCMIVLQWCVQVANYLVDRLGRRCMTAELLQPDELISGMISQVAAEPEMALLLNHFIYSTAGMHYPLLLWLAESKQEPLQQINGQLLLAVGCRCMSCARVT